MKIDWLLCLILNFIAVVLWYLCISEDTWGYANGAVMAHCNAFLFYLSYKTGDV